LRSAKTARVHEKRDEHKGQWGTEGKEVEAYYTRSSIFKKGLGENRQTARLGHFKLHLREGKKEETAKLEGEEGQKKGGGATCPTFTETHKL